ncbi:MAG: rRNA pseudouridine synthase [Acidobacteria bacterium]|nr:MAG: rRNA pseudouridine synthase [Acidobacteriota bacterium]
MARRRPHGQPAGEGGSPEPPRGAERLQKILSGAGVASRRAAERLIVEGRVSVNGTVVRELGTKADPDVDDVRVDGRGIKRATRRLYFLLNKPRGYVTTRSDPEGRRTVLDLLSGVHDYVFPVGRLDYDSEGLLLLTNDGELAAQLTHPSHEVPREYHARIRGVPDAHAIRRLAQGIVLDGRRTAPAVIRLVEQGLGEDGSQALLSLTLHEGRTRQVRRMCEAVGHPVVRLRRVRIGPISDPALPLGAYRPLMPREIAALKKVVKQG